jgi:predicted AlkP superfamily phosphohydrolase/phosphomutase
MRVLAIGLDGGTFALLEPLARGGVMPRLAGLMEQGAWGVLRSTVPPVTAPAWTSFLTGKNPGKHGIYQFFSLNPLSADSLGMGHRSYLAIPGIVVNSGRIPGDKLWTIVDRAGLSQVTINIPMAWPPERVNGVMVTGMLTPPGSNRMTWPPELAGELGDYEVDLDPKEKDFGGDNRRFLARVGQLLEGRLALSRRLMRERPWDFFMTVFTESDRLQHRFWDVLDPRGRDRLTAERRELLPLLEGLYRRMDDAIGELVDAAGTSTHVILLSDHGFGPAPTDLVDLRVLTTLVGLDEGQPGRPASGTASWWWRWRPTKGRVYRRLGFLPESWLRRAEGIWRRRRIRGQEAVLFKMHENVGGVWINVRDGEGRILDFSRRAAAMDRLRDRLAAVEWGGRRIVEKVASREELYHGKCLDGAPDLVFVLRDDLGILEPDQAPPRGELVVEAAADRPRKKGTHRMEGMVLLAGPGVNPGVTGEAAIEDTAAVILHLLGLPVPADMDGRVPAFAFRESFLAEHPVRAGAAGEAAAAGTSAYDSEEEQAIKDRLEGIGYLD